jgi:hypothetical protein
LLLSGCAITSADTNAVETVAQARALSGALSSVQDETSARAAAPAIEAIGRRLARLSIEKQSAGEPSPQYANMLDNELPAVRQELAQKATILQMTNPAAAQIVGEALTKGTMNPSDPTPQLPQVPPLNLDHVIPHALSVPGLGRIR